MAVVIGANEARDEQQDRLRAVWAPNPSVVPGKLEDADFPSCRHPGEWAALLQLAALVVLLGVVLWVVRPYLEQGLSFMPRGVVGMVLGVADPLGFVGTVLLVIVVMSAGELFGQWVKVGQTLAQAVEVNESSFPSIHPIVEDLRRRFSMPRTRVFVHRGAPLSGFAFGQREPYIIVISSATLGMLTPEELTFLIGHEMGHIKLGHTRLSPLIGSGHVRLPGPLGWLRQIRAIFTASYERAQEMSCDRVGVLATRDVRPAISTAVKLGIGVVRGAKLDVPALTAQAEELRRGTGRIGGLAACLFMVQPPIVYRLLAITSWAGLPEPAKPQAKAAAESAPASAPASTPSVAPPQTDAPAPATASPNTPPASVAAGSDATPVSVPSDPGQSRAG